MKQQLITMLEMQDRMNRKVHPDWINQHFEWYRALWIECGELIDHYGYKWWKRQTPEMEQVRLEVVDIWHFGMSMCFDGTLTPEDIAAQMVEVLEQAPPVTLPVLDAVEALAGEVLLKRHFAVDRFWTLMRAVDLDLESLYRAYVGKNVLNFFRQDHGYKDGSYRKVWAGREDNAWLAELTASLDSHDPAFPDQIYDALKKLYESA